MGEYDSNNALREETLWLGDTPVAVIQRDPATGLNQTYYVHCDHLNTPKALLSSANVPVWRSDKAVRRNNQRALRRMVCMKVGLAPWLSC